MFHVIEKELRWRRDSGRPEGFEALRRFKPIVAVGAEKPLGHQLVLADFFRMCKANCRQHSFAEKVGRWERWLGRRSYHRKHIFYHRLRDCTSANLIRAL